MSWSRFRSADEKNHRSMAKPSRNQLPDSHSWGHRFELTVIIYIALAELVGSCGREEPGYKATYM